MAAPKGNKGVVILSILGVIIAVGVFKPGIGILLAVGLAPTLTSWLVETSVFRALRLRTIFFFNLAGIFPFIADVLSRGGEFTEAYKIISNLPSLGIMYAPVIAAMGVLWAGPFASAFLSQVIAADRIRRVIKNQNKLVDEWGPDIVGSNKDFFLETGYKYQVPAADKQPQKPQGKTPIQSKNI